METLGSIGEIEAIRRLTAALNPHPLLRTGIGDDCAVTEVPGSGMDQVFTTDPVIEGVHFLPSDPPDGIGHKAVGRVLSDLAAMGAQPQWILVNVVATPQQDIGRLEEIYRGMTGLCRRFGATLIGGDLSRGMSLELHVFGTGTLPTGTAVTRSRARPGDALFVSGPLGCSIQGHHLEFVPRVEEGLFLRDTGWVSAMMDISDGLATDLRHILKQSRVGAILESVSIPLNGTLDEALYDGEDFELLFTADAECKEQLCALWRDRFSTELACIGTVTAETEILRLREGGEDRVLPSKAFEHFTDTQR